MSNRSIIEAIQAISGTQLTDKVYLFEGTVDSVSESARTCTCSIVAGQTAFTIPDVRLMASIDDGILIIPEIDSNVTIVGSTYTEPYITTYSGIEKIVFRGGDLGGMVKLLSALSSLNKIENDINTLKNAFNSWVVLPADGGAALKAIASIWSGQSLTPTKRTDLENTNITQG